MQTVINPHIEFDANGVPLIRDTMVKVIEVAMDHNANGWGPQEIHEHYPDLSVPRLYGALSYYYDHKEELDADIERRLREAEEIRAEMESSPEYQQWQRRMRAKIDAARGVR
jgi:uncharacterized protein (DUF433 family)